MAKNKRLRGARGGGSAPQPLPVVDEQHEERSKPLGLLKWLWEELKTIWRSVLIVTFLLAVITFLGNRNGVLYQRWLTEIGDHEKTRGELAREKDAKGIVTAERDQFKKELADLRKENVELKRLHPILEFYGPRAKLVRGYDLRKDPGEVLAIGNCQQGLCFLIRLESIDDTPVTGAVPRVSFGGVWPGFEAQLGSVEYGLSLKRECRITLEVPSYDTMFVVEDDRMSSLKAGIGISSASSPRIRTGWLIGDSHCPDD
jgi:hypothetical protein